MPLIWVYGCSSDGSAAVSCPTKSPPGDSLTSSPRFLQDGFVDASTTFSVVLCKLFCKKSDARLGRETKKRGGSDPCPALNAAK